jgi:hypothetical protein
LLTGPIFSNVENQLIVRNVGVEPVATVDGITAILDARQQARFRPTATARDEPILVPIPAAVRTRAGELVVRVATLESIIALQFRRLLDCVIGRVPGVLVDVTVLEVVENGRSRPRRLDCRLAEAESAECEPAAGCADSFEIRTPVNTWGVSPYLFVLDD